MDNQDNAIVAKDEINALMTQEYIDKLVEYEEVKAQMKVLEEQKKQALLEVMQKYNIYSFENPQINLVRVQPKDKTIVDTQKLKDDGLYDSYTKTVGVKEYVKVIIKYDE